MARRNSMMVTSPNLGLYLDRAAFAIPKRGLRDCLNVRIKDKAIVRDNLGWGPFPDGEDTPLNLDGKPVTLIDNFFLRAGGQVLLFGNTSDFFRYNEGDGSVRYLTPRYETGTVSVNQNTRAVTGVGTEFLANVKPGDYLHVGAAGQRDPAANWYLIDSVEADTGLTLATDYLQVNASGQFFTIRQVQLGDAEDYYESTVFYAAQALTVGEDGDRWYGTNGIDPVIAWDGTSDQMYRPDLGGLESARSIAVYKNTMLYINIRVDGDRRPVSMRSSAIGRPENVATLEASEFVIHSQADPLVAVKTIGDNAVLYSERSITLAQFVGPPIMYAFRTIVDDKGPRTGRAIADFGEYHRFIGPDAQYSFDGVSVIPTNDHVWRELLRRMSPQRFDRILTHFDEENGELLWVLPQNTDATPENGPPEQAYVEHYLEDVGNAPTPHTRRELPATATGYFERLVTMRFSDILDRWQDQNYRWNDRFFQATFPFNIFGTEDGDIFVMGTKDTKNDTPMRSYARFSRRALGNLRTKGVVQRVYPMVNTLANAVHTLTVKLYTTDQPAGTTVLEKSLEYSLVQNTSRHFVSPRVSARYLELEFETEGLGEIWTLNGYDVEVIPGSER